MESLQLPSSKDVLYGSPKIMRCIASIIFRIFKILKKNISKYTMSLFRKTTNKVNWNEMRFA